jgi:hypothetical protein
MVCGWEKLFGIIPEILWLREKLSKSLRACHKWFRITSELFRGCHIDGIIHVIIQMIFCTGELSFWWSLDCRLATRIREGKSSSEERGKVAGQATMASRSRPGRASPPRAAGQTPTCPWCLSFPSPYWRVCLRVRVASPPLGRTDLGRLASIARRPRAEVTAPSSSWWTPLYL